MLAAPLILIASAAAGVVPGVAATAVATVADARTVTLADAVIRIVDVVPDAPPRLRGVAIARMPAGARSVTLSRTALATLVRRAAPGIAASDTGGTVTFHRAPTALARPRCFVARTSIAAGAILTPDAAATGECPPFGTSSTAIRYDAAAGTFVTTRGIGAGEPIGAVMPRIAPAVVRGAPLTLVARSGPVIVERPVEAMQAARPGGRVFVRAGDGRVFAMPVTGVRP